MDETITPSEKSGSVSRKYQIVILVALVVGFTVSLAVGLSLYFQKAEKAYVAPSPAETVTRGDALVSCPEDAHQKEDGCLSKG